MKYHHIGFDQGDLGGTHPKLVLLSGEPERTDYIAKTCLQHSRQLSQYRGLNSHLGYLSDNFPVIAATSGIGGPSLSIVVNELRQLGITHMIRIGTCGSIQPHVALGSVVISQAALCRQGAANDIAPPEYPATADPFLTVALVQAAKDLCIEHHLGITASVDTLYEGQERIESSANAHLQRHLRGITQEYRQLNLLNYEMEAGTLFKMAAVYGFSAACICAVIAQRTEAETMVLEHKENAVKMAIDVVIKALMDKNS